MRATLTLQPISFTLFVLVIAPLSLLSQANLSISLDSGSYAHLSDGDQVAVEYSCSNGPNGYAEIHESDITVSGACTSSSILIDEIITSRGSCNAANTIHIQITATDSCGRNGSFGFDILLEDSTPPVMEDLPDTIHLSCIQGAPMPAAIDNNCDGETTVFSSLVGVNVPCTGSPNILTSTYFAIDDCFNATEQSVVFVLIDTTAPRLVGVPPPTTDCGWPDITTTVTAVDDCSGVVYPVSFLEEIDPQSCGQRMIHSYMAADPCGNLVVERRSYYRDNNVSLYFLPNDERLLGINSGDTVILTCSDEEFSATSLEAITSCNNMANVTFSTFTESDAYCDQGIPTKHITYHWIANTGCSQADTFELVVQLREEEELAITFVPGDTLVHCEPLLPHPELIMTNGCGLVDISVEVDLLPLSDQYDVVLQHYVATDECGRTADDYCVIVVALSDLTVTIEEEAPPICNGQEALILSSSVSGGYAPYRYEWYVDGVLVDTTENISIYPQQNSQIELRVTDDKGCSVNANHRLSCSILPHQISTARRSNPSSLQILSSSPNPANHWVDIVWNGEYEFIQVQIVSTTGLVRWSEPLLGSARVDCSDWPEGLYYILATDAEGNFHDSRLLVLH